MATNEEAETYRLVYPDWLHSKQARSMTREKVKQALHGESRISLADCAKLTELDENTCARSMLATGWVQVNGAPLRYSTWVRRPDLHDKVQFVERTLQPELGMPAEADGWTDIQPDAAATVGALRDAFAAAGIGFRIQINTSSINK